MGKKEKTKNPLEQVDITGLMQKPISGWEDRVEMFCKPEAFVVHLQVNYGIFKELTDEEWERMKPKLRLVEKAAQYMAAGMLKGTLKYAQDNYTLEQWFAHLIGEGTDQMNYQLLLWDSFNQVK